MHRIASLIFFCAVLAACTPAPEHPREDLAEVDAAERNAAIAAAERADLGAMASAFARLDQHSYTLRERLDQLDAEGRVNAYRRRTIEVEAGLPETVFAEARGTFDFGAFGRFVSFDDLDRVPQNPVPFVLQDDPPYLTPQGREAYHFAFGPDSTIGARPVRIVRITARPGEGDNQPLRSARLYLDAASDELVGLRLHRASQNLLFGETSLLELMLAPTPGGTWLPQTTDYRVSLRAALTATRRFQLHREYAPATSGQVALRSTASR